MKEFNYDSITTFMRCPLKYKFQYVDKIPNKKEGIKVHFRSTIIKAIQYFYSCILEEGKVPSYKQIEEYWGDMWFNEEDVDVIMGLPSEKAKMTKKGYSYLVNFYRNNKYKPGIPLDIDLSFKLNLYDEYLITGNIPLIRELEGKVEIVNFSTGHYKPNEFQQKNDIDKTINAFAFRQMLNKKEDGLIHYQISSNEEVVHFRKQKDLDKLLKIINNINKSIENKIYYPRLAPSMTYLCKQCEYNKECTAWKGK